jgi:hypothetical protein
LPFQLPTKFSHTGLDIICNIMAIDSDLFHIQPDLDIQLAPTQPKMNKKQGTPLPADFTPGSYDVVCAKGKAVHQHVGKLKLVQNEFVDGVSLLSSTMANSNVFLFLQVIAASE